MNKINTLFILYSILSRIKGIRLHKAIASSSQCINQHYKTNKIHAWCLREQHSICFMYILVYSKFLAVKGILDPYTDPLSLRATHCTILLHWCF